MQFSSSLPDAPPADEPSPVAVPLAGAYAQVLEEGFPMLRFPPQQESRYLQDKAAERLGLLRNGAMLVALLSSLMLVTDWLVVPDQLGLAVQLRLLFFTPLSVAWVLLLPRMDERMRERSVLVMSTIGACTCIVLCLKSHTGLGAPYLVSLSMILLFNGGVIRMRFWVATRVAAMMLALFAAAALSVRDPPVAVLLSMSVVMVSTAVFTLFHTYWQEHEDRTTWLLQQQEQALLDELGRANARLDRLSRFDPLTGLANRRHLDEFLQQAWERARRDARTVSLLVIDVDHFKLYNDRYGHPAGDVCLKQVADALKAQLRMPGDLVARAGGEEFVAVLGDAALPAALAAAERVRAGIAQLALAHALSPVSSHVTVSVGAATLRADAPGASPQALMAAADAALYRAKAGGRNAVAGPAPEAGA